MNDKSLCEHCKMFDKWMSAWDARDRGFSVHGDEIGRLDRDLEMATKAGGKCSCDAEEHF